MSVQSRSGGEEVGEQSHDPDVVAVTATYTPTPIPHYSGNPLIEALPANLSRQEAKKAMAFYPEYLPEHRLLEAMDREHMPGITKFVRHPVGLHAELHSRISRLMKSGYVARNPVERDFLRDVDARLATIKVSGSRTNPVISGSFEPGGRYPELASGMTFLGTSGMGKTAAVEMCLKLYPNIIIHREYKERAFHRTQIPYIHLNASSDGSIHSLISMFFRKVDRLHAAIGAPTNYARAYQSHRANILQIVLGMARIASQHSLGLLVLDEIQELNARGSRTILSFLVQLVNTVGVPVVLVGGVDAIPIIGAQFRQARRGSSEGDLILGRSEIGSNLEEFCREIWRYQYTSEAAPFTGSIMDALHEESQGITEYIVLAHKLSQIRAITLDRPFVTPKIIRSIRDGLVMASPVMNDLRSKNTTRIGQRGDVDPPANMASIPFIRGDTIIMPAAWSDFHAKARQRSNRNRKQPAETGDPGEGKAQDEMPVGDPVRLPAETLPALAEEAAARGKGGHDMLVEQGLAGDPLWKSILGADKAGES